MKIERVRKAFETIRKEIKRMKNQELEQRLNQIELEILVRPAPEN